MSGLEDLYREIILDHYRSPRNRGSLDTPPAHRTEGFNPLCGDEIIVFLEVGDDGLIDIRIDGQGCSISQSSASMMSAAVKGKTAEEAKRLIGTFKSMMSVHEHDIGGDGSSTDELDVDTDDDPDLDLGDLEALRGVVQFPVRIKCATLSWNTLNQAFDELAAADD
ncbi:MAG: Fe-S cluster assembly sulfur transfer protein SufU [Actinomycetota bacterium]